MKDGCEGGDTNPTSHKIVAENWFRSLLEGKRSKRHNLTLNPSCENVRPENKGSSANLGRKGLQPVNLRQVQ